MKKPKATLLIENIIIIQKKYLFILMLLGKSAIHYTTTGNHIIRNPYLLVQQCTEAKSKPYRS